MTVTEGALASLRQPGLSAAVVTEGESSASLRETQLLVASLREPAAAVAKGVSVALRQPLPLVTEGAAQRKTLGNEALC